MKYILYPLKYFKDNYFHELLAAHRDVYPEEPNPHEELVTEYEATGTVLAAVDGKKIAGFSVFTICRGTRYDHYYGTNLYFYVKKPYRNGLVAGRLIKGTEEFCASKGCDSFDWDVNIHSSLVQVFDKRKEYKKESIIYSKSLI